MLSKLKSLHHKYERWVPIGFFILGFLFDTVMLRRVDELLTVVQQAIYLLISAALIRVELLEAARAAHPASAPAMGPPRLFVKVWKYREALLHFMLGTLLNSYTIFYFKSSSAITSFLFIAILIGLLILNEFKRFGKSQTKVHVAFLSLCSISYLVSLVPIVLGFIGNSPFVIAVVVSVILFYGYVKWVGRSRTVLSPRMIQTHLWQPFVAIHLIFIALYFLGAIPPVPLSVSYMGIYHDIKKGNGEYELSYTRSKWKFWQHGDQTFLARPGDTIYCFAQVFSPTRFKDQLQVRWLYKDERRGWVPADAIPIAIVGGREEGYRAITKKSNYQPGEWRVQIETKDDREVGRIGFTVEADESTDPRDSKITVL